MELAILITSAGRRVGLLECFRRAADALGIRLRIAACDLDPAMSSACAVADRAHAVPRCTDPDYGDSILQLAEAEGAGLVVPTIDPELMPLACARSVFAEHGIRVHVGSPEVIAIVRDKALTASHLARHGIAVPRTFPLSEVRKDPSLLAWPVFAKPANGSASRGLQRAEGPADLPQSCNEPIIVQQLLTGPEFTVNIFVDRDGELRSVIPHQRLSVRAGEVEKGVTVRSPAIARLAREIVAALPDLRGASCFQLIDDVIGGPTVIEINARFGGGYPLADRAGATFARWLLAEAAGLEPAYHDDWRDGILMLRYDAAVFHEAGVG